MDRLTLTAGAFCLLISVAQPQGFTILTENRRINVTEGGNAFFSLKPSAAARSGSWAFKDTDVVVWIGAAIDFKNNYGERAEFFPPNGSLLLKSVRVSDSGDYSVKMSPSGGGSDASAILTLHVLAVPSSVKKLSVGGIIAIVIAVLFVVALIIGITAWMFKKKICRAKCGSQHNNIKMASRGNEPVSYSNGTNTQTTKPKDIDVVYAQPYILPQGPNASTASTEINKTDYAELKFK